MQRARQVDELTRHWSAILEKLEREPSKIHAAMLSETTFAAVFDAFVKGKHQKVNELLDLLKKAADAHRNDVGLGPSDYTRAWDQALKAFQRLHGLDEKGTPKADEA